MILFATLALAQPLTVDLDGDGVAETVDATMSEGTLTLALREGTRTSTLEVGGFFDIAGPKDTFEVRAVNATETGVPMLRIHSPSGEYCGSGNDWLYVSYTDDTLRSALRVSDFHDAPVWTSVETRFDPKSKTVVVSESFGDEGVTTERTVRKLSFLGGIYK